MMGLKRHKTNIVNCKTDQCVQCKNSEQDRKDFSNSLKKKWTFFVIIHTFSHKVAKMSLADTKIIKKKYVNILSSENIIFFPINFIGKNYFFEFWTKPIFLN